MFKTILIFFLFWPYIVLGQFQVTGKVVDKADQKPIPGASVFLSNASVGTATSPEGNFTLSNVRGGQYELVVSIVGYETYRQQIMVAENLSLATIQITIRISRLNEVTISPNAEWEHNYAMFKEEFLGVSVYAQDCKILNPEVLDLQYEKIGRVLSASSQDFLIIENNALGYRVKYLLNNFEKNYNEGSLYYTGSASFEDLQGKKSLLKRWTRNRLAVYKGSSMHFLRSVIADRVKEEGFQVLRLVRKPNPKYTGYGDKFIDAVDAHPLLTNAYAKPTDKKGLFVLTFDDCLFVKYNGGRRFTDESTNEAGFGLINTTITFDKPYAAFDNNGIFIDPAATSFNGAWGRSRMASLLPVDYEPGN